MTDYYCNNVTGDDGTGDGSFGNPYASISKVVSVLAAGDTGFIINTGTNYTAAADDFTTTTNGTSASPITLTTNTPYDPPVIFTPAKWSLDGADYWIISNLIFDAAERTGAGGALIQIGTTSNRSTNILIENVQFWDDSKQGIALDNCDIVDILHCRFTNLRKRSAGSDLVAIAGTDAYGDNIQIGWCLFEDIGSDGIQFDEVSGSGTYTTIDIHHCSFIVNRSSAGAYGSSIRPWQTFSTNVGENAIDIKVITGPVTIEDCYMFGFEPTVAGQDASGANGAAIVIQNQSSGLPDVIINRNRFHRCGRGITVDGTYAALITNNIFTEISDVDVLNFRGGCTVTGYHNTIADCSATNYLNINSDAAGMTITWKNNLIADCTGGYSRDATGVSETFDYNAWYNLGTSEPAAWQGGNDVTITTLGLDTIYAVTASSDAYQAGVDLSEEYDFLEHLHSTTPSLGACELFSPENRAAELYRFEGDERFVDRWSALSDANGKIRPWPNLGLTTNALSIRVDGSDAYVQDTYTSSTDIRFRIKFKLLRFPTAVNNNFDLIRLLNGSTAKARLRARTASTFVRFEQRDDTNAYQNGSDQTLLYNQDMAVEVKITVASGPGANDGTFDWWVNDTYVEQITGLDTDAWSIDAVRVGGMGMGAETGEIIISEFILNDDSRGIYIPRIV